MCDFLKSLSESPGNVWESLRLEAWVGHELVGMVGFNLIDVIKYDESRSLNYVVQFPYFITPMLLPSFLNTSGLGNLWTSFWMITVLSWEKNGEKRLNFTMLGSDFMHFDRFIATLCPSHSTFNYKNFMINRNNLFLQSCKKLDFHLAWLSSY